MSLKIYITLTLLIASMQLFANANGATTININECNSNTLPANFIRSDNKKYYVETFTKLSWYKAFQFCKYHGLNLVSVLSQEENENIVSLIKEQKMENELFWTSGTDLGSEGKFYWMSNGQPFTFTNWLSPQPDNAISGNETENCVHFWGHVQYKLKWNDLPCSFKCFFVCET